MELETSVSSAVVGTGVGSFPGFKLDSVLWGCSGRWQVPGAGTRDSSFSGFKLQLIVFRILFVTGMGSLPKLKLALLVFWVGTGVGHF